MSRTRRVVSVLVAFAVLVAGCGQDSPPGHADPPDPQPTATSTPALALPPGFPDSFPPPPDDAELVCTEIAEAASMNFEATEELGTTVTRSVTYRLADGADAEQVLDHYRSLLPAAGWPILDEQADQDATGGQLELEGEGYWRSQLHVTGDEQRGIEIQIMLTERFDDRPYSSQPPTVSMPDWYAILPKPPEGARRSLVRVIREPGRGSWWIDYRDEADSGNMRRRAAELVDHYRTQLPAGGWSIVAEQEDGDQLEVERGTIETSSVAIEFTGHSVTGRVSVGQQTDVDRNWQTPRLTIIIETVGPPRGGTATHASPDRGGHGSLSVASGAGGGTLEEAFMRLTAGGAR